MTRVKTDYFAFVPLLLVTAFCGFTVYKNMDVGVSTSTVDTTKPVTMASVGTATVSVPSWEYFKTGHMWALVSAQRAIPLSYTPSLTTTAVAHTTGADKAATLAEKPLESLISAANSASISLMLSSAYRSAQDQQDTYNALLALHGSSYVHEYVALPGTSEHQTGLAFDLANVSHGCELDPNACSLDANAIAWLRTNASSFGFIERYPSGKQSITGVAGEHWHYRYVGVPLAKALQGAHLTFDEFVQQVAPGYSR